MEVLKRSLGCQPHLDASTADKKVDFHFPRRNIGAVHPLFYFFPYFPCQRWARMSVHQLCYFPPPQVCIHPQIRSQITQLGSKHSLELDPHSAVTQPQLSQPALAAHSVLSSLTLDRLHVQNIPDPASLSTDTPKRFHYLPSHTAAMSLLNSQLPHILSPPPSHPANPPLSRCGSRLHP